jgi:hypothetical protein
VKTNKERWFSMDLEKPQNTTTEGPKQSPIQSLTESKTKNEVYKAELEKRLTTAKEVSKINQAKKAQLRVDKANQIRQASQAQKAAKQAEKAADIAREKQLVALHKDTLPERTLVEATAQAPFEAVYADPDARFLHELYKKGSMGRYMLIDIMILIIVAGMVAVVGMMPLQLLDLPDYLMGIIAAVLGLGVIIGVPAFTIAYYKEKHREARALVTRMHLEADTLFRPWLEARYGIIISEKTSQYLALYYTAGLNSGARFKDPITKKAYYLHSYDDGGYRVSLDEAGTKEAHIIAPPAEEKPTVKKMRLFSKK